MHSANITHCSTQIIQLHSETIITVTTHATGIELINSMLLVNSLQRVSGGWDRSNYGVAAYIMYIELHYKNHIRLTTWFDLIWFKLNSLLTGITVVIQVLNSLTKTHSCQTTILPDDRIPPHKWGHDPT